MSPEDEPMERIPLKKANRSGVGGDVGFLARYGLVMGAEGVCGSGECTVVVLDGCWLVFLRFYLVCGSV